MTKKQARERVALVAYLLIEFRLRQEDGLYPEGCADADAARIDEAVKELSARIGDRAGRALDDWFDRNETLLRGREHHPHTDSR